VSGGRGVAVVLGASGGIGAAMAAGLTDRAWDVVTHHRSCPPRAVGVGAYAADLTDWSSTRAMARRIVADHGPPELVVNCAGRRDDGLLVAQSPERWTAVLNDNVTAAYHPARAFLPAMMRARRGSLIFVASVAGLVASPGQTAYSAAKGAVVAMARTLAVEYGPRGIRVNVVAPGFVESSMTGGVTPGARAAIEDRQALPGSVPADDLVRIVALLAETPSITGEVIRADLGLGR
jgi:3-oxoacyl-[acyl-carrier protein] reductase